MSTDIRRGPTPDTYWLVDGRLLAGPYPATYSEKLTREKLTKFLDAGIRTFINLTEEHELAPYDDVLRELSVERGVETTHVRQSIRDLDIPRERRQMVAILSLIRDELAAERPVYIHCWGGIGRTGTVAGCWLVEAGLGGDDALKRIAELRRHVTGWYTRSPESDEQCRYVREWRTKE
jgi:protein-tyrosine phosphatase